LIHSFHSEYRLVDVDMLMSTKMIVSVPNANENEVAGRDAHGGPRGPEHSRESLCPFALSFVQTFA